MKKGWYSILAYDKLKKFNGQSEGTSLVSFSRKDVKRPMWNGIISASYWEQNSPNNFNVLTFFYIHLGTNIINYVNFYETKI